MPPPSEPLPFCPSSSISISSSSGSSSSSAGYDVNDSNAINNAATIQIRSNLHPTAVEFLDSLNLPAVHPLCLDLLEFDRSGGDGGGDRNDEYEYEYHHVRLGGGGIPPLPGGAGAGIGAGTPVDGNSADTGTPIGSSVVANAAAAKVAITTIAAAKEAASDLITFYSQVAPALLAITELWIRLFALLVAPLALLYLFWDAVSCWRWWGCTSDDDGGGGGTKKKKKGNDNDGEGSSVGTREEAMNTVDNGQNTNNNNHGIMNNHNKTKSVKTEAARSSSSRLHRHLLTSSIILGTASAAIVLTDSLYVHEFGRLPGMVLYTLLLVLSIQSCQRHKLHWIVVLMVGVIKVVVVICLVRSNPRSVGVGGVGGGSMTTLEDHHPGLDLPMVKEGLYYDGSNEFVAKIVKGWPETYRVYTTFGSGGGSGGRSGGAGSDVRATPWLPTGDSKTGIPFLLNSAPDVTYRRVWAHNEEDDEHVALDIAFPSDRYHNTDKPLYMILHGLNGGSSEEYVREFVWRRINEGSTCVVMVARGLMDTPVLGWNVFHGARTSDVHVASGLLRKTLSKDQNQMLAGVGFSMGAIVLANYVARSGTDCNLDAAMAVSGGLDMREQINFFRSQRLWQPMLAKELRDTFIVGKFDARYRHRLTEEDYLELMRSAHISEIDRHGVVTYNGVDDLMHYYSEMSAFGDHSICIDRSGGGGGGDGGEGTGICPANLIDDKGDDDDGDPVGRLSNIAIPFVALHALDDPLVSYRTVASVDPEVMVKTGSGNLILLLTKSGGHVGWPLGLNPAARGWEWMNNSVRDFILAVDAARKEQLLREGVD